MYCTQKQLESRFDADKINGWADNVPARITSALQDATNEVDGYLESGGYKLPLSAVPDLLINYTASLAAYLLLSASGIAQEDWDKTILDRSKTARDYLKKVADGKYQIPGLSRNSTSSPAAAVQSAAGIAYIADDKLDLSGRGLF